MTGGVVGNSGETYKCAVYLIWVPFRTRILIGVPPNTAPGGCKNSEVG